MESREQPPAFNQAPARPVSQPDVAATTSASMHHRDRRREKSQLSCSFCRRRKVRCDRQLPCQTCVDKGIAVSCTYTSIPQQKGTSTIGERIQQIETLVRSLVDQRRQQNQPPPPITRTSPVSTAVPPPDSPVPSFGGTLDESPQGLFKSSEETIHLGPINDAMHQAASLSQDRTASPAPSEYGSMRMHSHGANYVNSVHWAAVLDSISELKDQYEQEEEARMRTTSSQIPHDNPGPRLLYEPVHATKADILASIPARSIVDRMVAQYFNGQGATPPVLHSGQFLREARHLHNVILSSPKANLSSQYEKFWQEPAATPIAWVGLLCSILCLSTQYQLMTEEPTNPDTPLRVHVFRERTVQCLVLAKFTKGGAYILETLINHCTTEVALCKDADTGLWLLQGILVQLAVSLGYHRDPSNFSNISAFAGEMRRRVWAFIVQMDLRLSSQMGLPRLLKSQQHDTTAPRNLLDMDFDEETIELPPSRPETEVTPILYCLAKNRIDSISGLISDLVSDTREHQYEEIMHLDQKVQDAEASLPPIFRWRPLSQSFMVPPQIILHRIWLQLAVQRLTIWLHRKYLARSYTQDNYEKSRQACLQAAIKMLEFQQLVHEETQIGGQLYAVRWMQSSLLQSLFLLGMSVVCYYVQLAKSEPNVILDKDTAAKIQGLLRNTYPMWLRSSTVSCDARAAVEHLNLMLGLREQQEGASIVQESNYSPGTPVNAAMSLDQVTWDAYQECIANFPAIFGTDFTALESSTLMGVSMMDPMSTNTAELDGLMAVQDEGSLFPEA